MVEAGGCRLMLDPWLDGKVFNNGWELIAPTCFTPDEFAGITHIWFSHEHPDHFHPPSLMRIAPDVRAKITVLFQQTIDKRVADFCRKIGFDEVIELLPGEWFPLGADLHVLCEHYENGDSWIAIRDSECTLLNTNDCGMRDRTRLDPLRQRLGQVDVLATQFSYAFWLGNEGETAIRERYARQKMVDMAMQVEVFGPRFVIPIASFIQFCHDENHYLNDAINTAHAVTSFLAAETGANPVLIYPGDRWAVGATWDNDPALSRYARDYDAVRARTDWVPRRPVDEAQLFAEATAFAARMKVNAGIARFLLADASIFLWDNQESYRLSARNGLRAANKPRGQCDIELSAESLLLCLKEPWGADTLGINGRFRKPTGGRYARFYNLFRFGQLASRGLPVGPRYLASAIGRKIARRLGMGPANSPA